mgnify:FL=1
MCGIIGVVGQTGTHVNQLIYDGLTVLQHRGQDAAGIVTEFEGRFHLRKKTGLVKDVFLEKHMKQLLGHVGIGHVRYPTAGSSSAAEAQPFYVNSPYGISLAHNGNLTNVEELKKIVSMKNRRHMNTTSDSELLLNLLAVEIFDLAPNFDIDGEIHIDVDNIFDAVSRLNEQTKGSFACIALLSEFGLLAFRDAHGIRPLIFGSRTINGEKEWIVASESVAISALGFEVERDVQPGEAIFISKAGKLYTRNCAEEKVHTPCIFEHVYFARPDSVIDGISVYQARLNQGERLANRILEQMPEHDIDVVIPVPDSGRYAALQLARTLGIEYREGFVKNRYIGRTFIMPGQAVRMKSVRRKLNTIAKEFSGKNVILVDDSIVRGNTSAQIIEMARECGAKKVYFASAAPPVRYPNVYGIDMPAMDEFIANNRTIEEISAEIGSDRLFFQTLDDLIDTTSINGPQSWDASCFNGEYITGDITPEYLDKLQKRRNDKAKNLQNNPEVNIDIHNLGETE